MATLRRGLVDTVKKAAAKVGTRGVQVATKAGTRGARALVETTAAAVKTVDKIQKKLGRTSTKARSVEQPVTDNVVSEKAVKDTASKKAPVVKNVDRMSTKSRGNTTETEAQPVMLREAGRKTMPSAAPKRSKAPAQQTGFKVKRGQKHRHTGR